MKGVYLVSYDIKDEKRLHKVYNYLRGKGIHLQKSVFYCLLSYEEIKKMRRELEELINKQEDDIRFYPLLANFETIAMGQGEKIPKGVYIYLE